VPRLELWPQPVVIPESALAQAEVAVAVAVAVAALLPVRERAQEAVAAQLALEQVVVEAVLAPRPAAEVAEAVVPLPWAVQLWQWRQAELARVAEVRLSLWLEPRQTLRSSA